MPLVGSQGNGSFLRLQVGERGADELHVVSFRGREEMSELYAFELLVTATGTAAHGLERDALGARACLTIDSQGVPRAIHGIVRAAELVVDWRLDARRVVRLELVPRLWLLGCTRHSRIFQDQNVTQIVGAVLDLHGIRHRWALVGTYAARGYCVQHQESDLHFVRRLLAEEGIYFAFEHPDVGPAPGPAAGSAAAREDGELLVLGDHPSSYAPIPGEPTLPLRDEGAGAGDEHLSVLRYGGQLLTGAVRVKEFDFERPSLDLSGRAEVPAPLHPVETRLLVYDHHGHYEGDRVADDDAVRYLEQLRTRSLQGSATSNCPRMTAGSSFRLSEAPDDALNRGFALARVEHEGREPQPEGSSAPHGPRYENRLGFIPDDVVCRPARQSWSLQQILETATVVGPEGAEIHTDAHGRIKVQFHWDLQGRHNEHSSCWLRVMQNWSGTGWGFQFLPRVGMEVLVTFVGGDVDKPMVLGCVYNGEHPTPFPLPDHKTRSGIRTRSTLASQGYNELSFEDATGAEQVFLRAQKDLDERVLPHHTTSVGRDRTSQVDGSHRERVLGEQVLDVLGARSVSVGGSASLRVGADSSRTIAGDEDTTICGTRYDDVRGEHLCNVEGAYRTRVADTCGFEVGENLAFRAGGDCSFQISGNHMVTSSGDSFHSVHGKHTLLVSDEQAVALSKGSTAQLQGDLRLTTTACVYIKADEGIVLSCGQSTIALTADGIELTAPTLTLTGKDEAFLRGGGKAVLKLDGQGTLAADSVTIQARGSQLQLDSNAKLDGAKISFGSGSGAASFSTDDDSKPDEPPELEVELIEGRTGEPIANTPFTAKGHGPKPLEGTTDGSGKLRLPVHYEQCVIDIEAGHHRLRILHGHLEDIETQKGVAQRLFQLGFGDRKPELWGHKDTTAALHSFEAAKQLPQSTDAHSVSDATKAALREEFGA